MNSFTLLIISLGVIFALVLPGIIYIGTGTEVLTGAKRRAFVIVSSVILFVITLISSIAYNDHVLDEQNKIVNDTGESITYEANIMQFSIQDSKGNLLGSGLQTTELAYLELEDIANGIGEMKYDNGNNSIIDEIEETNTESDADADLAADVDSESNNSNIETVKVKKDTCRLGDYYYYVHQESNLDTANVMTAIICGNDGKYYSITLYDAEAGKTILNHMEI